MTQEQTHQNTQTESFATRAIVFAKGVAMGMGDSVPGISGGTIAVITHIYDKLIFSLRAIDLNALRFIMRRNFRTVWEHVNGTFLLLLALGILTGLVVSANTVLYLLDYYFEALMAFFIGLVLASTWILRVESDLRRRHNLVALALGLVFTVAIGLLPPANGSFSSIAIFLSGVVAICAMILPGISGAFILLLLGVYEYVLTALIEINLPVISVFVLGCIIGLLTFARVLAWLLKNFHDQSYGFIIGMLLGSLFVLWPWQHAQIYYTDSSGELHILRALKVMPGQYTELTGQDPKVLLALFSLIAGGLIVLGLQKLFAGTRGESSSH